MRFRVIPATPVQMGEATGRCHLCDCRGCVGGHRGDPLRVYQHDEASQYSATWRYRLMNSIKEPKIVAVITGHQGQR